MDGDFVLLYLDLAKPFKVYKSNQITKIKAINRDTKNITKRQAIIYLDHYYLNSEHVITFMNRQVFNKSNFKAYYKPNKYSASYSNTRFLHYPKDNYTDIINGVNYNILTKEKIKSYNNQNLIDDLSERYMFEERNLRSKSISDVTNIFYSLIENEIATLRENGYEDIAIVLSVSVYSNYQLFNKVKMNVEPGAIFARSLKNNLSDDISVFKDTSILFLGTNCYNGMIVHVDDDMIENPKSYYSVFNNSLKTLFNLEQKQAAKSSDTNNSDNNTADNQSEEKTNDDFKQDILDNQEKVIDEKEAKKSEKIADKVESLQNYLAIRGLTIDSDGKPLDKDLDDMLAKKLEDTLRKDPVLLRTSEEGIFDTLNNDKEYSAIFQQYKTIKVVGRSQSQLNRTALLMQKKQNEVIATSKLFADTKEAEKKEVTPEVNNKIDNIHEETKEISVSKAFDDEYMKSQYHRDIVNTFLFMSNNPEYPLYVTKINVEDNSDKLNKLVTYTVRYRDKNGKQFTIKLDIPKVIDGKYIYTNGTKKIITKQITSMPVVKIGPDRVYITTPYNKVGITRFGSKLNTGLEVIEKTLKGKDFKSSITNKSFDYKLGDAGQIVDTGLNTIEYNNFSQYLLLIKDDKSIIKFNPLNVQSEIERNKALSSIGYDKNKLFPVGYSPDFKYLILINVDDDTVHYYSDKGEDTKNYTPETLPTFVANMIERNTTGIDLNNNISSSPNLAYTRIKLIGRNIPLISLLGYEKGLTNIMDRYGVKYTILTKNKAIKQSENKVKIKFANSYLVYDSTTANNLLLSGLIGMNPANYNYADFDTPKPYLDYYADQFGNANIVKNFHNTIDVLLDPITLEILNDTNLPTNIIDLLLYTNTLLVDLKYSKKNDMSTYRIRGAEQIPAVLYKVLADAYLQTKREADSANPQPLSLPRNAMEKALSTIQTIEPASDLNPSLIIENENKASYKGLSGQNNPDTYKEELRAFSPSSKGIFSTSSPDSNKVGVVRQLSYDTNIVNLRGLMNTNDRKNDSTAIASTAELMTPFVSTYDDPPRIAMQTIQQKHLLPVTGSTKALYGSGIEKNIAANMPDAFIIKAKKDGKVLKYDKTNNLLILQYKDGSKDTVDLESTMEYNSNGGFYTHTEYEVLYKEGQAFRANDVLVKDSRYFKGKNQNDISYSLGRLTKLAFTEDAGTFEDSTIITSGMAKDMTAYITKSRQVVLDPDSIISFIAKKGSNVKSGDPLITFQRGFEDQSISKTLEKIGGDFQQDIEDLGNKTIRSHYTGKVIDIRIYRNVDMDTLSSSLKKIVQQYENKYKKKDALINKTLGDKANDSLYSNNVPVLGKIDDEKIKGTELEGVMIEFFLEYEDIPSVGDKFSAYTALKATVSNVIPEEKAPYSEYAPDEHVQMIFSPLSVVSRMTQSVYFDLYLNKGLINLKRQVKDLLK